MRRALWLRMCEYLRHLITLCGVLTGNCALLVRTCTLCYALGEASLGVVDYCGRVEACGKWKQTCIARQGRHCKHTKHQRVIGKHLKARVLPSSYMRNMHSQLHTCRLPYSHCT